MCRTATRSCFFRLLQGAEMLRIADKTFDSHLFTGTGKFASPQLMVDASLTAVRIRCYVSVSKRSGVPP